MAPIALGEVEINKMPGALRTNGRKILPIITAGIKLKIIGPTINHKIKAAGEIQFQPRDSEETIKPTMDGGTIKEMMDGEIIKAMMAGETKETKGTMVGEIKEIIMVGEIIREMMAGAIKETKETMVGETKGAVTKDLPSKL